MQGRRGLNKEMEIILHKITRTVLEVPMDVRRPNYVPFNQRMERLQLLSFEQRNEIAQILMLRKIMNDDAESKFAGDIKSLLNTNPSNIRDANHFRIDDGKFARGSPVSRALESANEHTRLY